MRYRLLYPSQFPVALSCAGFVLVGTLGPWLAPDSAIHMGARFLPPSPAHLLGTDHFGRDEFSLLVAGAQDCLITIGTAVGLGLALGSALGLWAALAGGVLQFVLARVCDCIFALPSLLIALAITAHFGAGRLSVIIALASINLAVFATLVLAQTQALLKRPFIKAADALGQSPARLVMLHIVPNLYPLLATQAANALTIAIVGSATLSYLGLGTQPPTPSWGRMLTDAQAFLFTAPRLALIPGGAIAFTAFGFYLFSEALQGDIPQSVPARPEVEPQDYGKEG